MRIEVEENSNPEVRYVGVNKTEYGWQIHITTDEKYPIYGVGGGRASEDEYVRIVRLEMETSERLTVVNVYSKDEKFGKAAWAFLDSSGGVTLALIAWSQFARLGEKLAEWRKEDD